MPGLRPRVGQGRPHVAGWQGPTSRRGLARADLRVAVGQGRPHVAGWQGPTLTPPALLPRTRASRAPSPPYRDGALASAWSRETPPLRRQDALPRQAASSSMPSRARSDSDILRRRPRTPTTPTLLRRRRAARPAGPIPAWCPIPPRRARPSRSAARPLSIRCSMEASGQRTPQPSGFEPLTLAARRSAFGGRLPSAVDRLPNADCRTPTSERRLPNADCRTPRGASARKPDARRRARSRGSLMTSRAWQIASDLQSRSHMPRTVRGRLGCPTLRCVFRRAAGGFEALLPASVELAQLAGLGGAEGLGQAALGLVAEVALAAEETLER
jgi:hypothetical protein